MSSKIRDFLIALKEITKGGFVYYLWLFFLSIFIIGGIQAYMIQWEHGLIVSNMRDQVSWGFYISNFTFLVGIAAAGVLLVIPSYLYNFKPIKEIAFLGEMMAITAIMMAIMFVTVDLGQPLRVWHMIPGLGTPNFPDSLLVWDVLVLNGYLGVNATIFFYILYKIAHGESYEKIMPLIILSIPMAISIHTVTAFLYNGLVARPFWNASILAPRFLASAFSSGPALMIIVVQIVRNVFKVEIDNKAIFKIAELIVYSLLINLFLLACEVFKEFYSGSIHKAPLEYLYFGLHGNNNLVPFMWFAFVLNMTALVIFIRRKTRENLVTLNVACGFLFIGVYIEKGMGLIVPGFIPGALGEIYEYVPSKVEITVAMGIWALGALIYTLLLKFTIPIYKGKLKL